MTTMLRTLPILALSVGQATGCALDFQGDQQSISTSTGRRGSKRRSGLTTDSRITKIRSTRASNPYWDEVVVVASAGQVYEFPGTLGIAPGWKQSPLPRAKRARILACLMDHVTYFEGSVPIVLGGTKVPWDAA